MLNITKQQLHAGDSWNWLETLADYPASLGYKLVIQLKHNSDSVVELSSTVENNSFRVTASSERTATLPAGTYVYNAQLSLEDAKKSIEFGTIEILPNLAASGDVRSYWAKIYDQLCTAYDELSTKGFTEVIINGKTIKYNDRPKMLMEIHNAGVQAGIIKAASKNIHIRFNS